jgi:hypothetical protein
VPSPVATDRQIKAYERLSLDRQTLSGPDQDCTDGRAEEGSAADRGLLSGFWFRPRF